jgi:hypothetical protein
MGEYLNRQYEQADKRFDEWDAKVDCNECSHYWDNSCDGVQKGQNRPCNSFLATRSIVLPERIKSLENVNKRLKTAIILLCVCVLVLTVWQTFGG